MKQNFENLNIVCTDGYSLSGRFYPSQAETTHIPILICPATGIVKGFYDPFASWLAEQGHPVLSFDFRGIGDSLHGSLKDSKARIQDWGQLDIPAAIETLINKTQSSHVTLIGHSAGGQLLGIVPNFDKVNQVISIAGSTGHVKGLKGRTKALAPVMFNIVFPLSGFFKGYGATKILGMGENLPRGVAKQWAQFCRQPGYVVNAVGKTIFDDYHTQITIPITSILASDDEIATEANVQDLLRLYPNAKTQMIIVKPQDFQHQSIGHMHMFRKSHRNMWPLIKQHILS